MNILPRKHTDKPALMGDWFDNFWGRPFGTLPQLTHLPDVFRETKMPPMNVAETEDSLLVTLEIPGLDEKDIDIELMGNQLIISGERKWKTEKKDKEYHRVESQFGSFRRSLTLPDGFCSESERIEAKYKKGMLEITIPKLAPTPTKKIEVEYA